MVFHVDNIVVTHKLINIVDFCRVVFQMRIALYFSYMDDLFIYFIFFFSVVYLLNIRNAICVLVCRWVLALTTRKKCLFVSHFFFICWPPAVCPLMAIVVIAHIHWSSNRDASCAIFWISISHNIYINRHYMPMRA